MDKVQHFPTSYETNVPLIRFFKYSGIYPYSLKFLNTHPVQSTNNNAVSKPEKILTEIGKEKSGGFVWLNKIVLFFWIAHTTFQTIQFIRYWILDSSPVTLFSLLLWPGTSFLGLIIGLKYWFHGEQICTLMTQANDLEKEIYREKFSKICINCIIK